MFKRIVVATDFEEHPNAAWDLAQELSQLAGAELLALDAELLLFYDVAYANVGAAQEEERRAAERRMETVAQSARARGISVRPLVRFGGTADAVVDTARTEAADLVIVGIHGRRRLQRLVERHVAEHIVRAAPCHVLIVKMPG